MTKRTLCGAQTLFKFLVASTLLSGAVGLPVHALQIPVDVVQDSDGNDNVASMDFVITDGFGPGLDVRLKRWREIIPPVSPKLHRFR